MAIGQMAFALWMAVATAVAAAPATLRLTSDWEIKVEADGIAATVTVDRPEQVKVVDERIRKLPVFNTSGAAYARGERLNGVRAQECSVRHALDPESLAVRLAPGGAALVRGKDYDAELSWGCVGRLEGGSIGADTPVFLSYTYGTMRLDSVVLTADRKVVLRRGVPMLMDRDRAASLGQETLRILAAGSYRNRAEEVVNISTALRNAKENTRAYPPDQPLPRVNPGQKQTLVDVLNETTLDTSRRLVGEGHRPVALNFASATHPGGGFLTGARAQEESLARSSGLYACLAGRQMYEFHRAQGNAMYSNYAIYSPDVPVFRSDDGALLDKPYLCSFITSPAMNAKVVLEREPGRGPAIREAMRERIHKVLTVAAIHGHSRVVLGAWGCGAFGNDANTIADLFREALGVSFQGVFDQVVFAVTDWSPERRFIGPFSLAFAGESAAEPA